MNNSIIPAERLILMAAGTGSRMAPLTEKIPKPLVKVKGKRMIDTILDAALEAGIQDIIIVRGYRAKDFDILLNDYPMIRFVENEFYDKGNNVVSAYCVRDLLGNAYIAEADLVLRNPKLIQPFQACSNYLGVPCDSTSDWAFQSISEEILPRITDLLPKGGNNVHHMFGISFWTEKDAKLLANELEEVVDERKEINRYFEEIPLDLFAQHHNVYIRECSFDDIVEIDNLDELAALDPEWHKWNS